MARWHWLEWRPWICMYLETWHSAVTMKRWSSWKWGYAHSQILLCNLTINQNCFSFALEWTKTFPKNHWLDARKNPLFKCHLFSSLRFFGKYLPLALYSNVQNLPIPVSKGLYHHQQQLQQGLLHQKFLRFWCIVSSSN